MCGPGLGETRFDVVFNDACNDRTAPKQGRKLFESTRLFARPWQKRSLNVSDCLILTSKRRTHSKTRKLQNPYSETNGFIEVFVRHREWTLFEIGVDVGAKQF